MNKTQELIEKLKEYPDRELIFMYPDESSEYAFTLGYPSKVLVDEYVTIKERVWLRDQDGDVLFEDIADEIAWDDDELNDEEVERRTIEKILRLDWKKAIVVYISY